MATVSFKRAQSAPAVQTITTPVAQPAAPVAQVAPVASAPPAEQVAPAAPASGFYAPVTGGSDLEPTPEGIYLAICVGLWDIGTQTSAMYGDKHKVVITWEIPSERIELERDGVVQNLPRQISKRYTLSMHEKSTMRKDIEAWRNSRLTDEEAATFNLFDLLGAGCQLQVMQTSKDGRTYANVNTIMAPVNGMDIPQPETPPAGFVLQPGLTEADLPEEMPGWIVNLIRQSKEWSTPSA